MNPAVNSIEHQPSIIDRLTPVFHICKLGSSQLPHKLLPKINYLSRRTMREMGKLKKKTKKNDVSTITIITISKTRRQSRMVNLKTKRQIRFFQSEKIYQKNEMRKKNCPKNYNKIRADILSFKILLKNINNKKL